MHITTRLPEAISELVSDRDAPKGVAWNRVTPEPAHESAGRPVRDRSSIYADDDVLLFDNVPI